MYAVGLWKHLKAALLESSGNIECVDIITPPSLFVDQGFQRILALTGPAGTAKTTTVRILAREMDFEILEWRNAIGENSTYTSGMSRAECLGFLF